MRLIAPGGAPGWFGSALVEIERAIRGPRDAPMKLQPFANSAALPPAADWPFGIVFMQDIQMVAVSTGSVWKRLDTGATI